MSEKNNANQQVNQQKPNSGPYYNYQRNTNAPKFYPGRQMQPNQPYPYQQYPQNQQFVQYQQYPQNQYPYTYPPFQQAPQQPQNTNMLPMEQSYIENILRLNLGKRVSVHMTFEQGGKEGNVKVFNGVLQAAGRDHIIISDPETGERYLLLMIYLDYVIFPEEINYQYPFGNTSAMSAYPPR